MNTCNKGSNKRRLQSIEQGNLHFAHGERVSFERMNHTQVVNDNQFGLRMCVLFACGQVGMDYHYTVHIVHMDKHRYAYLICCEQRQ